MLLPLLTPEPIPAGLGQRLLLACPALLVLLVPCALRLRRPPPRSVAAPG